MNAGVFIAAGAIVVSALACFAGRYSARRTLLRGRTPQSVSEIVSSLPAQIDRDGASELFRMIGTSFQLPPELLRLDDPISKLTAFDSWVLGIGQDKLERWLEQKGVQALPVKPNTIRDLIVSALPFDRAKAG
jgi:hypothetical protein